MLFLLIARTNKKNIRIYTIRVLTMRKKSEKDKLFRPKIDSEKTLKTLRKIFLKPILMHLTRISKQRKSIACNSIKISSKII